MPFFNAVSFSEGTFFIVSRYLYAQQADFNFPLPCPESREFT